MSVAVADRFQVRLEGLSEVSSRRLLRAWDAVVAVGGGEAEWIAAARPLLAGAAGAAVNLSAAYAALTAPEIKPSPVSQLIVPAAAAHAQDPMMTVGKLLGQGLDWGSATAEARTVVESVGSDAVMGAGRESLVYYLPDVPCVRRLNSNACPWCLSLSGVVWPSYDSASFGHANCKCVPTPVGDVGDHNDRAREAAGWDDQAKITYKARAQIAQLKKSEDIALKRSRDAAAEALSETDPARLERLSIREQDWETRAERAAERRRILETGSHRLAA